MPVRSKSTSELDVFKLANEQYELIQNHLSSPGYQSIGTGSVSCESYKYCLQRVRVHISSLTVAAKISQSPKFLALQQEQL